MKTIEIKEDGKVSIKYLCQVNYSIKSSENIIQLDNVWYLLRDTQPYLYKDHNGVEVVEGQRIFWVQTKDWPHRVDELWKVFDDTATGDTNELDKEYLAIFTTREAADKFVADNRPFEFITEDGVTPFKGDHIYCLNKADLSFQGEVEYYSKTQLRTDIYLWFYSEEAANDYIKKKKLSLSLDIIEKGLTDEGHEWSNPVVQEVFRTITNLVNEQFKPQ